MAKCKHSIYDTDPHFFIDPITRQISTESKKVTLIQGDHNSERFTFEAPRFIEGHDLSLCNSVQIHYINVDKRTKEQHADVYEPDDFQVFPEDDSVVVGSWLVSGNATKYAGTLSFVVRFSCTDGSAVEYAWNSAVYSNVIISDGINNSDIVIEEFSDVLEEWRKALFEASDTGVAAVNEARDAAIEDINRRAPEAVEDAVADLSEEAVGPYLEEALANLTSVEYDIDEDGVLYLANAYESPTVDIADPATGEVYYLFVSDERLMLGKKEVD